MNQNDAIIAAQSLVAEAERLQADAQAARGEADALRSAIQGPSEVVQQIIARLAGDADAKVERAHALERAASNLLSRNARQDGDTPDALAALDAFAKANLSPLVAQLVSAVKGQEHTAGQPGPNGSASMDMQAIGKILEGGLQWLAKGGRGQGGRT